MRRANSRSKWQDVLGYDDGYDRRESQVRSSSSFISSSSFQKYAPSISKFTSPLRLNPPSTAKSSHTLLPIPLSPLPPVVHYPTFPASISILHHPNGKDFLIRPYLRAPKYGEEDTVRSPPVLPWLFHVEMQYEPVPGVMTSRPEIVLYSSSVGFIGGHAGKGVLVAFSKFHSVTASIDVTLCPSGKRGESSRGHRLGIGGSDVLASYDEKKRRKKRGLMFGEADGKGERPTFRTERVSPAGGFFKGERYSFACSVESGDAKVKGTFSREKFEWRVLKGKGGGNRFWEKATTQIGGMRLIRVKNGQVVATYHESGEEHECEDDHDYFGNFKFLGQEEGEMGGEFDVLAVMSLLSIVERSRRKEFSTLKDSTKKGFLRNQCGLAGLLE